MRIASAAMVDKVTLSAMLHFCRGEKLGWDDGGVAMLFPAAAFNDAQSQEQKEKRHAQVKDDDAGVQHAAREIQHLLSDVEKRKHLRLPVAVGRNQRGQKMQNQQCDARHQRHHRREHLALGHC